jgi:hypothetical protein
MISLWYAPELVEEAVLLAERRMSIADQRTFRGERDPLYEVREADRRDEAFRRLHERWFERLGFRRVVDESVGERPEIACRLSEGRVLPALTRHEQGADLIDRVVPGQQDPRPLLAIRLRPSLLLDAASLQALLRHELLHIDDMLNPVFGYERSLPPSDLGPLGDNVVRMRYRVVWDVTVDGRLMRAGVASEGARSARWREFGAAFPMLGERGWQAFERWFDGEPPTHAALAEFARRPVVDSSEVRDEKPINVGCH